jgi:hypothetical protein
MGTVKGDALDRWSEWEARHFPDESGRPMPTDEWGDDAMTDGNLAWTRNLGIPERLTEANVPPMVVLIIDEADELGLLPYPDERPTLLADLTDALVRQISEASTALVLFGVAVGEIGHHRRAVVSMMALRGLVRTYSG